MRCRRHSCVSDAFLPNVIMPPPPPSWLDLNGKCLSDGSGARQMGAEEGPRAEGPHTDQDWGAGLVWRGGRGVSQRVLLMGLNLAGKNTGKEGVGWEGHHVFKFMCLNVDTHLFKGTSCLDNN